MCPSRLDLFLDVFRLFLGLDIRVLFELGFVFVFGPNDWLERAIFAIFLSWFRRTFSIHIRTLTLRVMIFEKLIFICLGVVIYNLSGFVYFLPLFYCKFPHFLSVLIRFFFTFLIFIFFCHSLFSFALKFRIFPQKLLSVDNSFFLISFNLFGRNAWTFNPFRLLWVSIHDLRVLHSFSLFFSNDLTGLREGVHSINIWS